MLREIWQKVVKALRPFVSWGLVGGGVRCAGWCRSGEKWVRSGQDFAEMGSERKSAWCRKRLIPCQQDIRHEMLTVR